MAKPETEVRASDTELLCCDWNKYEDWKIVTGGVDRVGRIWDLRMVGNGGMSVTSGVPGGCVSTLMGHSYAIRRILFSPHAADVVATSSYDMTSRIWATSGGDQMGSNFSPDGLGTKLMKIMNLHTEFVVGLGWSLFEEGKIASAAWDSSVLLWRA
jgi:peroxin-7